MNNLQIQQNKAAKIILDKAKYSSATNALEILKWKLLDERRHMHRCICIFRCLNDIIDFDFNLKHKCRDIGLVLEFQAPVDRLLMVLDDRKKENKLALSPFPSG